MSDDVAQPSPSENAHLRRFHDLEEMSRAAAEWVTQLAEQAVERRGRFSLVLSGGSTPQRLYELLGTPMCHGMPWEETHLFWSDERFVPKNHPDSNYASARAAFLHRVPVPPDHVHRVPTDMPSPEHAARTYEERLRLFFLEAGASHFDLVLLGLGADGHTASLFPEHMEQQETDEAKWVKAVIAPPTRPPIRRVTLTLKALNSARRALFLVSGAEKANALTSILDRTSESRRFPATRVRPTEQLTWFADDAAFGR